MEQQQDNEGFRGIMDEGELDNMLKNWLINVYPPIQEIANDKLVKQIKEMATEDLTEHNEAFVRYTNTTRKKLKKKKNTFNIELGNTDQFPLMIIRGIRTENKIPVQILIFLKAAGDTENSFFILQSKSQNRQEALSNFLGGQNQFVQKISLMISKSKQGEQTKYRLNKISTRKPYLQIPQTTIVQKRTTRNKIVHGEGAYLVDEFNNRREGIQNLSRIEIRLAQLYATGNDITCFKLNMDQGDYQNKMKPKRKVIPVAQKGKITKSARAERNDRQKKKEESNWLIQRIQDLRGIKMMKFQQDQEIPPKLKFSNKTLEENKKFLAKIIKQKTESRTITEDQDLSLMKNLRNFKSINCTVFKCCQLKKTQQDKQILDNPLKNFENTNFDCLLQLCLSQIQMVTIEPIGNIHMPNLQKIDFSGNYLTNITPLGNLNTSKIKYIILDNNCLNEIDVLTEVDWPNLEWFSYLLPDSIHKCIRTISYRKMMKMKTFAPKILLWIINNLNAMQLLYENHLFYHLDPNKNRKEVK